MARRRDTGDEDEELLYEDNEETQTATDDGEMERKRGRRNRKRSIAPKDDSDEEDEETLGRNQRRKKRKPLVAQFLDIDVIVDNDEEEEDVEIEDGFIVDDGAELPDEDDGRRNHRRPLLAPEDDQEDVEALARSIHARYARSSQMEYDEEATEVEQQALLPSVKDTKLWLVKCKV